MNILNFKCSIFFLLFQSCFNLMSIVPTIKYINTLDFKCDKLIPSSGSIKLVILMRFVIVSYTQVNSKVDVSWD